MMPLEKSSSKYVHIDQYWSKIGEMTDDENGSYKYPQLVILIKCILSLNSKLLKLIANSPWVNTRCLIWITHIH